MSEIMSGSEELSPKEKQRQIIENNMSRLSERKEAGELDKHDFGIRELADHRITGEPVTKSRVGNRAIVVTQDEFDDLGYIEFVSASGEVMLIEADVTGYESSDRLIIFPEELGNPQE